MLSAQLFIEHIAQLKTFFPATLQLPCCGRIQSVLLAKSVHEDAQLMHFDGNAFQPCFHQARITAEQPDLTCKLRGASISADLIVQVDLYTEAPR